MRWRELNEGYHDRLTRVRASNPHEILGLAPGASKVAVRSAYLKLVRTYHPDVADPFVASYNQEMLKLINQAYAAVSAGQL